MKFNLNEVLTPFNKGNLQKGDVIFAADNIKNLRASVQNGLKTDMFEFAGYSDDEDLPFKSGRYGVTNYRYVYKVKDEEQAIHNNDWLKYV